MRISDWSSDVCSSDLGWSARTAYNRAQILYRIAEVAEDRRPQFVDAVQKSEGLTAARADKVVDEAIDRLVWYAGWADKIAQVTGGANPVAGPFFTLSSPEPTGLVARMAPHDRKSAVKGKSV